MADRDELQEATEAFDLCVDASSENHAAALADLKFARLGEQWPEQIRRMREARDAPCLTINKLPTFIRQVVNDSRQNKPQIKVRPVDGAADVETADVINGLIRNIEQVSNADVAYDTAVDFAASCGFGFIRVDIAFAHDMSLDKELRIKRVSNPFAVYPDPHSVEADSSDWNLCFITEAMAKSVFEARYPKAEKVDWQGGDMSLYTANWTDGEQIIVAEYWKREEYDCPIVLLSDGMVVEKNAMENMAAIMQASGLTVVGERTTKRFKITQKIMSGAEILSTDKWAGQYIPVVPVYGDEINVEGKRYFHSLIRHAKSAQQRVNYWASTTTELVGLQPKAPYIGPVGFAAKDPNWTTANSENHPYLEYDGPVPPQRQGFASVPAGALQEMLNANDDLKSIVGLYDASLGARSNETSGKAIMARQREGDVSTFHIIDNLSRAIRHTGKILIDLIPLVYTGPRIVRVLGEQGDVAEAVIGGEQDDPKMQMQGMAEQMQKAKRIYDLNAGKYDLVTEAGPSFTTRRAEAAEQMVDLIRAFPDAAPVIGDLLAKSLDWPGAEEIARRLKALLPPQLQEQPELESLPPEAQQIIMQMQQQAAQMGQQLQEAQTEASGGIAKANADMQTTQMEIASNEKIKAAEIASNERITMAELMAKQKSETDTRQSEENRNARDRMHETRMNRMTGQMLSGGQPMPADPFDEQTAAIKQLSESQAASTQALMEAIMRATQAIIAATTAPKVLIRDPQGRPAGVETVRPNTVNGPTTVQ